MAAALSRADPSRIFVATGETALPASRAGSPLILPVDTMRWVSGDEPRVRGDPRLLGECVPHNREEPLPCGWTREWTMLAAQGGQPGEIAPLWRAWEAVATEIEALGGPVRERA